MKGKLVLAFCLLQMPGGAAFGRDTTFDYSFILKEVKAGAGNHVEFLQISDTPIVYRAWGVWNFGHPASEVADGGA